MVDITKTKKGDIIEVHTRNSMYTFEMQDPKLRMAKMTACGRYQIIRVGSVVTLGCLNPKGPSCTIIEPGLHLSVSAGKKGMQTTAVVSVRIVDPKIN